MKQIKLILISTFILFSGKCFSQKFNVTIGSSNILFENFNQRKIIFNGASFNYSYYFKRFGWTFDFNAYLPTLYYGKVSGTPVYVRGGGISVGAGLTYKVFVSESQKTVLQTDVIGTYFNHSGNYNTEPFIRIYGGYDYVSVNFFSVSAGLKLTHKFGNLPLSFSLRRYFKVTKSEYNDFEPSGYTELRLGITFPIVFGPPPSNITKIKY